MLSVQVKLPRRTVVKMTGDLADRCNLACIVLPQDDDSPERTAVVMFSRTERARRFIDAHDLEGWLPAFVAYSELRELLAACEQEQGLLWGVVDFCSKGQRQLVKAFRLGAAIAAIDESNLNTDDPIVIEGNCFAM